MYGHTMLMTGFGGASDGAASSSLLFGFLDRLNRAAFLLAPAATVLGVNESGSRLLADERPVRKRSGRLEFIDPVVQRTFTDMLPLVLGDGVPAGAAHEFAIRAESETRRPVHAELVAVGDPARAQGDGRMAILMLTDLAVCLTAEIGRLATVFHLTEREATVAVMMAAPTTESQLAKALGITPNTLRTHRKNIYAKLGVSNRVELAIVLARLT